jgi:uncharacterized membrane protein YgcG
VAAGERQNSTGAARPAGPFTAAQTSRIERVLTAARQGTGLNFNLYVGHLNEPTREHARQLLGRLDKPAESVLIAVSPNQRVLEIVTGSQARTLLPDRECALAALSMVSDFTEGNLVGGVVTGLSQLAGHAERRVA